MRSTLRRNDHLPACIAAALMLSVARAEPPQADSGVQRANEILMKIGIEPQTIQSADYVVLFNGERSVADQRRKTLQLTRRNFLGFMRQMKVKVDEKHPKLLAIVLDTPEQMRRFFAESEDGESQIDSRVAGYYSPKDNWVVFYNQREDDGVRRMKELLQNMESALENSRGGTQTRLQVMTPDGVVLRTKQQIRQDIEDTARRIVGAVEELNTSVTQHEGVHQLAFNIGLQSRDVPYPFWVSEGLACVFEVPPEHDGGKRGAARVNGLRLGQYRELQSSGRARPLSELIRLGFADALQWREELYPESWAAFDFLFNRYPEPLARYISDLSNRRLRQEGADESAAFEAHFKQSLIELQKQFDQYMIRRFESMQKG